MALVMLSSGLVLMDFECVAVRYLRRSSGSWMRWAMFCVAVSMSMEPLWTAWIMLLMGVRLMAEGCFPYCAKAGCSGPS